MTTVISVENLSKSYRLGQIGTGTFAQDLAVWWARVRGKPSPLLKIGQVEHGNYDGEELWALKDVSFTVQQGEVLGIIGRNGAGKSTLLKILSRVTAPTSGVIKVKGRVASLLEVGTGFHPELTGRENVYLNGAILGMTKAEVARKFDEIVDFAGVEKFIDTPVKRYSSGMYVRLAFAVAAHLDPEILVVDEVLAVGDAEFQKKCLGKMGEVAQGGRTVLLVSHNMGAIARLCKNSIWLDLGEIQLFDSTSKTIKNYSSQFLKARAEWISVQGNHSSSDFSFSRIVLRNRVGVISGDFRGDEAISIEIDYVVRNSLSGCQIGIRVYNSEGVIVFTTSDVDQMEIASIKREPGFYRTGFAIPPNFLAPGTYFILVVGHYPRRMVYELIEQAVVFEVSAVGSTSSLDDRRGIVAPLFEWKTTHKR